MAVWTSDLATTRVNLPWGMPRASASSSKPIGDGVNVSEASFDAPIVHRFNARFAVARVTRFGEPSQHLLQFVAGTGTEVCDLKCRRHLVAVGQIVLQHRFEFDDVFLATPSIDQRHPDRDDVDRSRIGFVLARVARGRRRSDRAAGHAGGDFALVVAAEVWAVDHADTVTTSPS